MRDEGLGDPERTVRQAAHAPSGSFGPNAWLVEDMYDRYRADPAAVGESWQEFFADYQPVLPGKDAPVYRAVQAPASGARTNGSAPTAPGHAAPPPALAAPTPAAPALAPPATLADGTAALLTTPPPPPASEAISAGDTAEDQVDVLRGAASRIASNMEASLGIPTATSVRVVPARLLEVNRAILNDHLARSSGTKVSFTHLIGFAVVRAMVAMPALNSAFVDDADGSGAPGVVRRAHVGLGLAVDVERRDGRMLLVPCVRQADSMDFREFVVAYEDLVRKVHTGKIGPDDFAGTTVTLTNPGTLGTAQSVPRLMPGQGAIIGVGAISNPPGFEAADARTLADLGVGRTVTLTSTYDHRIIQGAESGLFLAHVSACLTGEHHFYEDVFASMGVPYEPARWRSDANAGDDGVDAEHQRLVKQMHVQTLINMYRVRGHLIAHLDPLDLEPPTLHPELDPLTYGLTIWDLPRRFLADGLAGREVASLDEIQHILRDAYCRTLGIEYMHIQDPEQKRWIQREVEGVSTTVSTEEQRRILGRLNAAEVFERFLHSRYVGQKRFGLEGAESTIVLLDTVLDEAAKSGTSEVVMGMAHRGRLNVLANIVGKSYREIFEEFEGNLDPESVQGSGDVKYHKGAVGTFTGPSGIALPVTLASNPSHLEAVDPVVEGMARAKQDRIVPPDDGTAQFPVRPKDGYPVLSLLIHGDAAFAGQGVVAETLNLSALSGYRTGGTVHVVINNQLGFTTAPLAARSSFYPTDVAKMVQAPIFHVNGDDPEATVRAARLAFRFRQQFHKDVVIDLVCYRRHGHNEGDDPSYTQPLMYQRIQARRSVRKLYTETLVRRGDITLADAEAALDDFNGRLQAVLDEVRTAAPEPPTTLPVHEVTEPVVPPIMTGVDADTLTELFGATMQVPDGFTLHPKLARQLEARSAMVAAGSVDWSTAEQLAIASLLAEGTDVRLTGQDTRRGTFSQRHDVVVDYVTGQELVPLTRLEVPGAGSFTVRDSLLSEYAAVGFEYGYSIEAPDALVAWEAQFGDFVNGAEIIIDNFLVAAEDKWGQHSSLVLLLPHGFEGQGPEHSSARVERFLSLAARGNLRVVQPSTAAQYFHVLRAQVRRSRPTPLVVMTPKSMLRAPASRSPLPELSSGWFRTVIDDADVADPATVQRVVLASGKVAHEALAHLRRGIEETQGAGSNRPGIAVVRVEQLYPWPEQDIATILARYPAATEVVWLQEEPENMGAWTFVHGRLHRILRDRYTLRHVSRVESANPATGSSALHQLEQADLLARAVG